MGGIKLVPKLSLKKHKIGFQKTDGMRSPTNRAKSEVAPEWLFQLKSGMYLFRVRTILLNFAKVCFACTGYGLCVLSYWTA